MVTSTGKSASSRRSVSHKILMERGIEMAKNGEVIKVGQVLYRASSQSTADTYYDVKWGDRGWECECSYYKSGHAHCKHTCAVVAMQMTEKREGVEVVKTVLEEPKIVCKCGSHDHRVCETYKTNVGITIRYRCCKCRRRFTFNPGFKGKQFPPSIITDALIDAAGGLPPGRIVERMAKNGVVASVRTIQRWIDDYGALTDNFSVTLPANVGPVWSIDEVYQKTSASDKKHWMVSVIDNKTRMVLASEMTDTKFGYNSNGLIDAAIRRAGRVPAILIVDGLSSYKKGFEQVILDIDSTALLLCDVGIDGKHVHNNKHERYNGEKKDCARRVRGFRSKFPGLLRLHDVYYNFVHKHSGIGTTPAVAAGIAIFGLDKLRILIQHAALAAT